MINPKHHASPQFKDEFWDIVIECLIEIHSFSQHMAAAESNKLRARIETPPPRIDSEIFYHNEPFDIANNIAVGQSGNRKIYSQCRQQYEHILKHHNWR